jgi:curved DNA-binding protein CbpA
MKDYYAILGVLPSIDQAALKAVYTALMKKFHPDTTQLDKSEAEVRAKEINEAYSALSDPLRRAEYDVGRRRAADSSGDYRQESARSYDGTNFGEQFLADWRIVVLHFPEVEKYRLHLRKISISLADTFQILIVTEKLAREAKEISYLLEKEFLKTYFGTNAKIHEFVIYLILNNFRDALLEINNYIRVIGTPPEKEVGSFISDIKDKFSIWEKNLKNDKLKKNDKKTNRAKNRKEEALLVVVVLFVLVLMYAIG